MGYLSACSAQGAEAGREDKAPGRPHYAVLMFVEAHRPTMRAFCSRIVLKNRDYEKEKLATKTTRNGGTKRAQCTFTRYKQLTEALLEVLFTNLELRSLF